MSGPQQPSALEIEAETKRFHNTPTAKEQESEFVHDVYNEIAQHFSQTRYKPWPIVADFLATRETNALGVDVGCGNGKYLAINDKLYIVGSDYSTGLIEQAKQLHKGEKCNDIMVADGLNLPHPTDTFDFAISIAVIHHFADSQRRVDAIKEILRVLKKGGQALIYCWALEQKNSRRGYHEGMDQDVLVPWVLAKNGEKKQKSKQQKQHQVTEEQQEDKKPETESDEKPPVKMRFYHLYKEGELIENCTQAGGRVVRDGYERDNWWAVVEKI